MNMPILYLLNIFLILIENIALVFWGKCFFASKRHGIKFGLYFLLLAASNIITIAAFDSFTIVKFTLLALIDSIWLNAVLQTSRVKSLVAAVGFLSFITISDNLLILGIALLLNQPVDVYFADPYAYYSFCYAAKCVELFVIALIWQQMKQRQHFRSVSWQDWIRIIMFPTIALILAVLLLKIYTIAPDAAEEVLLCTFILLCMDVLSIGFLNYLEQQQQTKQNNELLKQSIQLERENLNAWMDAYNGQRKQTHDFQNQLSVICGLAEREAPAGELLPYVKHLLNTSSSSNLFVKTGRNVVDVILNQKHTLAQANDIQFRIQLDDLSDFALSDDNVVIVLSNLLDNAIDACKKIPDPAGRRILLKMQVAAESSFLYIENTTAQPVTILNNQIVPSQARSMEHGYGLKNVLAILEQSNAIFAFDYRAEEQVLCFSAQIPHTHK
jgi:signal transduction histidine kinase